MRNLLKILRLSHHQLNVRNSHSGYSDVFVSGGGIGGLATAIKLALSFPNKRIVLAESMKLSGSLSISNEYSNRVVALSPQSYSLLAQLGIDESDKFVRLNAVESVEVWDEGIGRSLTFNREDIGIDRLMWIAENNRLQNKLVAISHQLKNLEIIDESKVEATSYDEYGNSIILSVNEKEGGESTFETSLLIAAEGTNSNILRKFSKINSFQFDYRQKGIVSTLIHESSKNSVAFQRFLKNGEIIGLLPLSENRTSLVWSTNEENVQRILMLKSDEFISELNYFLTIDHIKEDNLDLCLKSMKQMMGWNGNDDTFHYPERPPNFENEVEKSRAAFPLFLHNVKKFIDNRVIFLGDTAHRIHPMAGQGLNLTLSLDIPILIKNIERGLNLGEDIGHCEMLRRYDEDISSRSVPMIFGLHFLHQLHQLPRSDLLDGGRRLFYDITNNISQIKKYCLQTAIGFPPDKFRTKAI
ncbi:hypothetical protein SNEBB_003866 [Seison nebaliae]|nr:hypothetical protein SNEBB_003866 [Seison nebaliae]